MKEFVFRKNLWTVDFITSAIFAIYLGFRINLISDEPEYYEKRDLVIGVLAYVIVFVLAVNLRKRIVWLPSWAWLGIFGALIRILLLKLLHFPQLVEYELKYSPSFLEAFFNIISKLLGAVVFNWIIWGFAGLFCIFAVRVIVYIIHSLSKRMNWF